MKPLAWGTTLTAMGFLAVGLAIDLTGRAPNPQDLGLAASAAMFGHRLRDDVELVSLVSDLRRTIRDVVEPSSLAVWVPGPAVVVRP